ncbi:MAG: hypothetical protein R3B82_20345 [Sandaracinaceae bacterium]
MPRRVAPLGVPLAMAQGDLAPEPASPPTQPRTDTGLALLALEGRAIAVSEYFRRVYEYAEYEPALHGTMLGMHVLRMRERLLVEWAPWRARRAPSKLVLSRGLSIRDPRCGEGLPPSDAALARAGSRPRRPRASSRALGVPLRTMQRVLQELVLDDGLVRVQEGRAVAYRVEDTTFSEPTRSRRFDARGLAIELDEATRSRGAD